jgi:hypothetical protein
MKKLAVVVILVVIGGLILPTNYIVTKELPIPASVSEIHPYIENLDSWGEWTTWKIDDSAGGQNPAQMQSGLGSGHYFIGGAQPGWFVITDNSTSDGFKYDVISEGKKAANGEISYLENGNGTIVIWSVSGDKSDMPIVGSYLALVMDLWLGAALKQNLVNLKEEIMKSR